MKSELAFDFEKVFKADDYLYFYDEILTAERLQLEVSFLANFTQLHKPCRILDVGCGFGRHAHIFSAIGHHVTGIDTSLDFLAIAQENCRLLNLKVDYRLTDMREMDYKECFDRAFCLFSTIGYFSDEENEKVFKNIYDALVPGGIFCFDSHARENYPLYSNPESLIEKEGNTLRDSTRFDPSTGIRSTIRSVTRNGVTDQFEYFLRLYGSKEIEVLLKGIGFKSVKVFGSWNGTPMIRESRRMVVVAQK